MAQELLLHAGAIPGLSATLHTSGKRYLDRVGFTVGIELVVLLGNVGNRWIEAAIASFNLLGLEAI
eukprot:scaffold147433_cov73-Cyclotella_meneghiniana.AAC.1